MGEHKFISAGINTTASSLCPETSQVDNSSNDYNFEEFLESPVLETYSEDEDCSNVMKENNEFQKENKVTDLTKTKFDAM